MRVLLVDDDPTTLAVVARRLEVRGHVVETRTEAIGTSAAIRTFAPHAIVLDVSMPAVNGDQLARLIGKGPSEAVVVLLSDRDQAELARLAEACGADGFLPKRDAHRLADLLERLSAG